MKTVIAILVTGAAAAVLVGCASDEGPRYVERVPVAAPDTSAQRWEYDRTRPMPDRAAPAPEPR